MTEKRKYIIELEEELTEILLMKLKNGENGLPVCTYETVNPYTEPDLDAIRKEAYAEGYKEGMQLSIDDAKLKESYQQGLSDAWWYMQKILLPSWLGGYGGDVIRKIFEIEENHNIGEAVLNYSASEAIEKIREYEHKQEEKDGLRQNIQIIIDQCGYTIDEIAEMVQKIREE